MKLNLVVLKTSRPDDLAQFYGQLGIKFENHRHGTGPIHYASDIDGELKKSRGKIVKEPAMTEWGYVVE
jgi:hypothetical protein